MSLVLFVGEEEQLLGGSQEYLPKARIGHFSSNQGGQQSLPGPQLSLPSDSSHWCKGSGAEPPGHCCGSGPLGKAVVLLVKAAPLSGTELMLVHFLSCLCVMALSQQVSKTC